jgi:hypothetical protein
MRKGEGLQVEPRVRLLGEFALHGYMDAKGSWALGRPTEQRMGPGGAWAASVLAEGSLASPERDALVHAAGVAAERLRDAGYTGPFNIDAFRYEDAAGGTAFHPLSELNARFSMGWSVGMGGAAPWELLGNCAEGC